MKTESMRRERGLQPSSPSDRVQPSEHLVHLGRARIEPLRQVAGIEDIPSPRRAWVINVVAILVAVAVIMLGVGVDSPRGALVVGLLFGVPVVLVAITAAVAARRSRG